MRRCRREIALQDGRGGGVGICLGYGARDRVAVGGEGEWGRGGVGDNGISCQNAMTGGVHFAARLSLSVPPQSVWVG